MGNLFHIWVGYFLCAHSDRLHFSVGKVKLILVIFLAVFCLFTLEGEGDQPTTYTALLNDLERSNPKLLGTLNCDDLFLCLSYWVSFT